MKEFAWFIVLSILVIFSTDVFAAKRVALVIGNSSYQSSPLKNPANDANDIATSLNHLDFKVILKTDATKRSMLQAISEFGKQLKGAQVGLFFFAGHGIQVGGINYLIPVGAHIENETDVEIEGVDARRILGRMESAANDVNIIFLDACRNNPFSRSFRSSTQGLAKMNAPKGTFIAYATAPGNLAADGDGRNSPFTKHLLRNITEPDLPIETLLKKVRANVLSDTNDQQMPWQSSSLTGEFSFNIENKIAVIQNTEPSNLSNELEAERKQIERERAELERLKHEIAARKKIETDREKLKKERLELERLKQEAVEREKIKKEEECAQRDSRFCKLKSGPVQDTSTGLMWASRDNGQNINWSNAQQYCENYSEGGFTDWRPPTTYELEALYDKSKGYKTRDYSKYTAHVTRLIRLTAPWSWASNAVGSKVLFFNFDRGKRSWTDQSSDSDLYRVLPVRVSK